MLTSLLLVINIALDENLVVQYPWIISCIHQYILITTSSILCTFDCHLIMVTNPIDHEIHDAPTKVNYEATTNCIDHFQVYLKAHMPCFTPAPLGHKYTTIYLSSCSLKSQSCVAWLRDDKSCVSPI